MGSGHAHRAGPDEHGVVVARGPRLTLLSALAVTAAVTLVCLVLLWPDQDAAQGLDESVDFAAPGVTFPTARVDLVEPRCPEADAEGCDHLVVTVGDGTDKGSRARVGVPREVAESGLERGDSVRLVRVPARGEEPAGFSYFGTERSNALLWVAIFFVGCVVAVARWRGAIALLGLTFSGLVIASFMLPALLLGGSGLLVGMVGSTAIMFVVLYATHGISLRTSTALAGTLVGLALTAAIGVIVTRATRLTGFTDEGAAALGAYVDGLDFQGLLTCALIVAGLGVLNDVTITQSSAVWELRGVAPQLTRRELFARAMRIGQDHIASTIYTIVFAYAGAALTVLLVLDLYGLPLVQLLATEEIGQEAVRTLASSIGLVLAVPVTTAIAAATVPGARAETID